MNVYCPLGPFRAAALLGLVAAYGLSLPGPVVAQDPAKPPPSDAKPAQVQVIYLKYTSATEVALVLQQVYAPQGRNFPTDGSIRIVADERTNAILVSAPPAKVAEIQALISKGLDVAQAERESARRLSVFELKNLEPDKALAQALQMVFQGRGSGSFALDQQRKLVVVSADEITIKAVEALLQRLEDRPRAQQAVNVQVRVVWLASGPAPEGAAKPPDDLKEVLPSLAKLGIERPYLVAQTLVNVAPNAQFDAKGLATVGGNSCQFSVTGRLRTGQETPSLEISLRARQEKQEICNLQTEINVPPGHLVVLGMTPTESHTSVFVVQLLPGTVAKPGPRK